MRTSALLTLLAAPAALLGTASSQAEDGTIGPVRADADNPPGLHKIGDLLRTKLDAVEDLEGVKPPKK